MAVLTVQLQIQLKGLRSGYAGVCSVRLQLRKQVTDWSSMADVASIEADFDAMYGRRTQEWSL